MALPPKFAAHRLLFGPAPPSTSTIPPAQHTLELYVDYCCPFSAKAFRSLTGDVADVIRANPAWAHSLALILRQQVQPWHPSSTLMHESALAVLRVAPDKFWAYSAHLFEKQTDFFDVSVVNEKRNDTYRRLAGLAGDVGVDGDAIYGLLAVADKPGDGGALNAGNKVTDDLKLVTKMNRLTGVHVTPTVVFDGVVQDTSSSWTVEQWKEWLGKNVK